MYSQGGTSMKKLAVLTLIALLLILAAAVPIQAKTTRTISTGSEVCSWPPAGGTHTYHDSMEFYRDGTLECRDDADNPMGTGINIVTFNANWDANGFGPMWGRSHFVTDEGGVWDLSWNQNITPAGGAQGHAEGRGSGLYQGLLVKTTLNNGSVVMEILNPGGSN
jgi:hypothetical protein